MSALGHGSPNMIVFRGRNDDASETILKGESVSLDITAIVAADGLNNDVVFSVAPHTTNDSTAGQGAIACGVALNDAAPGEFVQFCVLGLVQVMCEGTAAVGAVINPGDTDGQFGDAANATQHAPCGIQLETGVAGELKWAFVDFISASFGGGVTGSHNLRFWGTAF